MMSDAHFRAGPANAYLDSFLQEHAAALKNILAAYVLRAGLATGSNVPLVAEEIFQDTVLQVMNLGERFLTVQQPRTWFIRVALHVIQRRRVNLAKRYRFEVLLGDLASNAEISEEELLDQLAASVLAGPEQAFEAQEQVREMLSMVSSEDARLLHLMILYECDAATVSRQLGITPEAVRVRLHRALRRLRIAWNEHESRKQRGGKQHG